ncbi:hypothetical protein QBC34DRAFT_173661 [Podospora aff. communis PSN243]|uniref:Uncharacterized protein n=1 Tax=Podospora aff. communis PSN243 TaxID=3040156 RepID=A0AAV9GY65_9PEZI|nr:hypothetical protein QBC34DRAFT_173661 [Podospora aff. communis PSN243]
MRLLSLSTLAMAFAAVVALPAPAPALAPIFATCEAVSRELAKLMLILVGMDLPAADEDAIRAQAAGYAALADELCR